MLENEYQINYFIENGFEKKICYKCNKVFWTQDTNRRTCGDTPCDIYEFIGYPIFKNKYTINTMRKYYIDYFKEKGHAHVSRYPVVARWRSDIYLTIASIANFQPFVTSGISNPPANPLVISQPCIRLNDIDSVGKTGRHLTTFEMMAHHVFNSQNKEYYWKDQTVKYCNNLLLELGIKKEDITYIENPCYGGGNAGASVEVMVKGLELATLVFMNLKEEKNGSIIIKNKNYNKMENYIVDTGYGLERFVWASQGTPTIYDALFPDIINELLSMSNINIDLDSEYYKSIFSKCAKFSGMININEENEMLNIRKKISKEVNIDINKLNQIMNPIEKIYAIVDHTRCLSYMLMDGIIPSNVKSGYLARLVIRKVLNLISNLNLENKISLYDILRFHIDNIQEYQNKKDYLSTIEEILTIEKQKYDLTLKNGEKIIRRELEKYKICNTSFPDQKIIELYDSHGIQPEITKEICSKYNFSISYPTNFYSIIGETHNESIKNEEKNNKYKYIDKVKRLPVTRKMYYDEPERFEFEAVVLEVFDKFVILDSTLFYPNGGGQESDHGTITSGSFCYNVINVEIENDIIIHELETKDNGLFINKGDIIVGQVDKNRRIIFTKHHTSMHIINDSCKKVLGEHIWQAGSQILLDGARLDITHYKNITLQEMNDIENIANKTIMENKKVQFELLERTEAEQKYGFSIYQGGVPKGKMIRIVKVGSDIEACSGTHCSVTGSIGIIKIVKIDRIQDGIYRIEFKSGEKAIEYIQNEFKLLKDVCDTFSVQKESVMKTACKFFLEWKHQRKEIERLNKRISKHNIIKLLDSATIINNVKICDLYIENNSIEDLLQMSRSIEEFEVVYLIGGSKNEIFQIVIGYKSKSSLLCKIIDLKTLEKKLLLDINMNYSVGYNHSFLIITFKDILKNELKIKEIYFKIKNRYYNIINNLIKYY